MSGHRERHISLGFYLKDIIFAANDGIVTTFAVVAGVVGAALSPTIILIIGFANLIADGFSMATGNYLGTKSEREFYAKEESIEKKEVDEIPEKEREEVREILIRKGYDGDRLNQMLDLITSNKQYWIDFMMHEEIGLFAPPGESAVKRGAATFLSFVLAGSLPLLPYVIFSNESSFTLAVIFSASALFVIGALRKFFSGKSWLFSGLEMLLVGGTAAVIAYFIGFGLKFLVG